MVSIVVRASIFVAMVSLYVMFLLSMMGYFELAHSSTETSTLKTSLPKPTKSSIDLASPAIMVQKPKYSPLVAVESQSITFDHDDNDHIVVHSHAVYPCSEFEENCETYYPTSIKPRRSIIAPEPVVARSGDVVRSVFNWAWGFATKGAKSTYNDVLRTRRHYHVHAKKFQS